MAVKCTECGASIQDDSRFCSYCGAKIQAEKTIDINVNKKHSFVIEKIDHAKIRREEIKKEKEEAILRERNERARIQLEQDKEKRKFYKMSYGLMAVAVLFLLIMMLIYR